MTRPSGSLSVLGGVSIGTGVMIGAGVFALMGQIAEAAGAWFPLAFVAAAVVAAVTGYSYAKLSSAYPSSGGIGRFLGEAYGFGAVAAGYTVAMYISMVLNESLVARTFGTYVLQLFGVEQAGVLVPALGIVLLIAAFFVNAASNRVIESSENALTVLKVAGLVVFAVACIAVADFPAAGRRTATSPPDFIAGVALAILAYKGFTTITTTGDEMEDPERNVGRAIGFSIALVTVVYLVVAVAVRGNLSLGEIVAARDYALAEAARPVFGAVGFELTAGLAAFAAISSVLASVFATSRILEMLSDKDQIPKVTVGARLSFGRPSLVFTVGLAIALTAALDLSRVAALGAFAYLSLDAAVHWGHLRHLSRATGASRVVLAAGVAFDLAILTGFTWYKASTDPLIVVVASALFATGGLAQVWYLRRSTASR